MLLPLMLDVMAIFSVCFSVSLFFSSGLVYFAPFHLHLIPWATELEVVYIRYFCF